MRLILLTILFLSATTGVRAEPMRAEGFWPLFRGDSSNSGRSPSPGIPDSDRKPWLFQTGKGIFSTAVIDANDNVYIGSADSWFYSLSPQGRLNWKYQTDEIIDSAATLSTDGQQHFVTVPSGDGYLHQLRLPQEGSGEQPELLWKFNAAQYPNPHGKGYNWFEGNVVVGPDGGYFAGNTNWNYYALNGDGQLRWSFPAKNMNWSAAAFDNEGHLYTASLDFHFRKMRASDGTVIWDQTSLGFNAGSLALVDQLVIATSFDHKVYALSQSTGRVLWSFRSQDHIYGSVAISQVKDHLRFYVTSTDGRLYALDASGKMLWSFDSGDVIRSSPVVKSSPEGRDIIYFGGGDGRLYAINEEGTMRWAFDTNSTDPYLRERNDLNASPALTSKGVVIGGEHGQVWFVPYDYPRLHPEDPRSILAPLVWNEGIHSQILSPGSSILNRDESFALAPTTLLTLRLQNIKDGQRMPGGLNTWFSRTRIKIDPPLPFTWQVSASADTVFIKPDGFWQPGITYRVSIDGQWMSHGWKIGALEIGASEFTDFQDSIDLAIAPLAAADFPWSIPDEKIDAFEIYRLAVNQPSMMPSLNQIGFDSYHWLVSILAKSPANAQGEGQLLAWVLGARQAADGSIEPNDQEFRFPMSGTFKGESFILKGDQIAFDLGGIKVNFRDLEFRGQFTEDRRASPQASFYARPAASSDLSYVPAIAALGLLNNNVQLPMSGTFLTRPYRDHRANQKPQNLAVKSMCVTPPSFWKDGSINAILQGMPQNQDFFDFVVTDTETFRPLTLVEKAKIQSLGGNQWRVSQRIPRGSSWPLHPDYHLMINLYPLGGVGCSGI